MITASEMRACEERSERLGVTKAQLMENAGKAAARVIQERYPGKTLVLAYHGNNGGDGFVVARELGADVWFLGKENKLSPEARAAYERVPRFVNDVRLDEYDVLIDALLGTGAIGDLRSPLRELADAWNNAQGAKVALDIPTGVDSDTGDHGAFFAPDLVVTFHDAKPGIAQYNVVVVDIGVPEEACGRSRATT